MSDAPNDVVTRAIDAVCAGDHLTADHAAAVLAAALFVAGASDAITDVAQNAHALRVQRNYGRSIINSFHAVWAIGAVTGGLMGAAAIALDIPRSVHLGFAAALFSGR